MRSLVTIFVGVLTVYSLYLLSYTWFVNSHEKAMGEKAQKFIKANYPLTPEQKYPGNKDLQSLYKDTLDKALSTRREQLLDSTKDKSITWWGTSYQKAKESELLLGLDLQGGINVTMDIELTGLIKGLANNAGDPALKKTIDEATRRKVNSDIDYITLFARTFKELNPGTPLAPLFANSTRNKLKIDASDNAVVNYLREQAGAAMKQTYQVLQKRIDKFGVAQPNINLDENKGIITVELAGAKDPERVRNYLQSTANLQFWEVYTLNDASMQTGLMGADKALVAYLDGTKTTVEADTAAAAIPDSLKGAIAKADTVKKVVDSQALAAKANPLFKVLIPAQGSKDENGAARFSANVGFSRIRDTAKVNEYLSIPAVVNNFPGNIKFLWGKQQSDDNGKKLDVLELYAIKTIPGKENAQLEGEAIENARQDFDPMTSEVIVSMSMNKQGTKAWADMTTKNTHKPIAIVLDNIVYSAPFVNEPITGGESRITMGRGRNSAQNITEAQDLANILKSGKLQAPAKIVQEQVVGPTLGQEAVHGGSKAFIISFLVIFTLMLIYYNTGGWVANIALVLNLLFTVGVLAAFNATLTAAGIAGLVLTIGMAVDTNVIIFERIKEELTRGKGYQLAVKDGYRRSLAPVLDAHITTLLTACILFYFGLGPVLGFATTQIIGILLSLLCGIVVSRIITDFWTNKNRHFNYFTPVSKRIFKHSSFNFIKYRKLAYGISIVVLILGIAAIFNGFKEGVEFSGGRSFVVDFGKPVQVDGVRDALDKAFGSYPVIKTYGSNAKLEITTDYHINLSGEQADKEVKEKLYEGLKSFLPEGMSEADFEAKSIEQSKRVDPTISDDLKAGAKWATFWALLAIALYILIRFRDWRYSVGTIIALMHDVLVTLAVFSFLKDVVPFPLEIDQHFIAAILTVIGFWMNDTVIVFDRVREYSHTMKGASRGEIINKAINDTLSRTIMTSLTVFLTILILFLVGGEVTKGFAFAMLIGIITGTYSSIFVAAPVLLEFGKKKPLGKGSLEDVKGGQAVAANMPVK